MTEIFPKAHLLRGVLLKLLRSLDKVEYRGHREFLGYIMRVLRNYFIDLATNQKAREISLSGIDFSELKAASGFEFAGDWASGNVAVSGGDFSKLIHVLMICEKIELVNPMHGLVFELRVLAGFERPEIAAELGLSEQEVDRMLRHARSKFRSEWKKAANQQAVTA